MKRLSWIALVPFFAGLISCSESALSKKLSTCDSLVIQFNAPNSDSVVKTFQAVDKKAIVKVVGFIDSHSTEEYKCGYDGNLIFYSAGKAVLPVMFKFREPKCRHFVYQWEGATKSTNLNQEAVDFLETLESGKSR